MGTSGIWYDSEGNYFDEKYDKWRQAGTGYFQEGIYWVDPATGKRFWQGSAVSSGAATNPFADFSLGGEEATGSGSSLESASMGSFGF